MTSKRDPEPPPRDFRPVFVRHDGAVDEGAARIAVAEAATGRPTAKPTDPHRALEIAKSHLEKTTKLWDWDEDVEFLGMSFVEFV